MRNLESSRQSSSKCIFNRCRIKDAAVWNNKGSRNS